MPAMYYRLSWPDDSETEHYSPSLVIRDFFTPGTDYSPADFLGRIREATHIASERVREKFGFPCSRALSQLHSIELAAGRFLDAPDARITVLSFREET